jgi:hypothetical protein
MNAKKKWIEESNLPKIFSDIEVIHSFNSKLLEDLEPIVKKWSPTQCLGNIFLKIVTIFKGLETSLTPIQQMDFLKIYTGYVQNFNSGN